MILIILPVVFDGFRKFKHMTDIFITPKFPVNQMFDVVHGGRWTPLQKRLVRKGEDSIIKVSCCTIGNSSDRQPSVLK
jgi:hypothetical protein